MCSACFFISRRPFSSALSFLAPASNFAIFASNSFCCALILSKSAFSLAVSSPPFFFRAASFEKSVRNRAIAWPSFLPLAVTSLFFESVSSQSTFICTSAWRAPVTPLKKSLLFALSPVFAIFKFLAISWVDFQNGLFFGVLGSRPLSARAALIIAASALFASSSKVLPSAFFPADFFWSLFATTARICAGFIARATAKRLSERHRARLTSFFMVADSLAGPDSRVYGTLGLRPWDEPIWPETAYQSSVALHLTLRIGIKARWSRSDEDKKRMAETQLAVQERMECASGMAHPLRRLELNVAGYQDWVARSAAYFLCGYSFSHRNYRSFCCVRRTCGLVTEAWIRLPVAGFYRRFDVCRKLRC